MARSSRRTALLVVGVVVAVGIAGLVSGRPARHDTSAPPSTTAETVDTSVSPASTASATTTAAPASTTTAVTAPTTTAPYGNCHALPRTVPTGLPDSDVVLGLITIEGEVLRLDTGTGELTCVRAVESRDANWVRYGGVVHAWRATGGTIARQEDASLRYLPDDGAAEITDLAAGWLAFPAGPDTVWVGGYGDPSTEMRMDLVQVRGSAPRKTYTVPFGAQISGSDGRGGLLVDISGSTFVLRQDGSLTRLMEAGRVLGVGPNHIVTTRADIHGTAQLAVVDRSSGRTTPLGASPPELAWAWDGLISPSGSFMAFGPSRIQLSGSPLVFDLRDRQLTAVGRDSPQREVESLMWSHEGDRLFWLGAAGTLHTWTPGSEAVRIGRSFEELPVVRRVFELTAG